MTFPANVFYPTTAQEAPEGALVFARGDWWLKTNLIPKIGALVPKLLALTGERCGQLTLLADPNVLAVSIDYDWEVRVEHPTAFDKEAQAIGTITLGEGGIPAIWGHIYGDKDAVQCISLDGHDITADDVVSWNSEHRYSTYQVWLKDRSGKTIGCTPLFTK